MVTVAVEEAVTTRLEITGGAVSPWGLLVVLAQATGLDEAALTQDDGQVPDDLSLSGVSTWAQVPVVLVVAAQMGGRVMAVLTVGPPAREEGRGDVADRDAVADAALAAAADWLDVPTVRWHWRSPDCVDASWHCGWRLASDGRRHHPTPVSPAPTPPVAAWRRHLAAAFDAALFHAASLLVLLAVAGLVVRRWGLDLAGLDAAWVESLVWRAGTGRHAMALVALAVLARRAADVLTAVLDPADPDEWPWRWWARGAAAVRDVALVVLLAAAVVLLGGGWLG